MRYTFEDQKTNEGYELDMPSSEVDQFLIDNPNLKQVFKMAYAYNLGTFTKRIPDNGYREQLKRLHKFYDNKQGVKSSVNPHI